MPSDTDIIAGAEDKPVAWMTIGICVVLVIIFAAETVPIGASGANANNLPLWVLVPFGGLSHDLVAVCGDWWRLFTGPMLHGGFTHLLFNAIALYFCGRFIELHKGPVMLAGLLAIGCFFGALASISTSAADRVSIGTSGGIMAVLAAAILLCYTLPEDKEVLSGKSLFLRILIPSLIPTHDGVDYAAHFGGAVAGLGAAAMLCGIEAPQEYSRIRTAIAGCAAAMFLCGAVFGAMRLVHLATEPDVPRPAPVPAEVVAKLDALLPPIGLAEPRDRAAWDRLVDALPDPDARRTMALALLDDSRPAEAKQQAILGLRELATWRWRRHRVVLDRDLRVMIALSDVALGRREAARSAIDSSCVGVAEDLQPRVAAAKLCP